MTREMPTCKKCSKQHWFFQDCSKGVTHKRVGYDTLQTESAYVPPSSGKKTGYKSMFGRTDYKQTHGRARVHYQEEERDG